MSHIDFFASHEKSLSHLKFGQVALEGKALTVEIIGSEKKVHKFGLEDLFRIREKIQLNLAEIQSTGTSEDVKKQLEGLKGKLITKINSDRGWFKKMSQEETELVDAYFNHMNTLLDTPASGKIRQFLSGAFKIGVVGALAYGAYRYFGQ